MVDGYGLQCLCFVPRCFARRDGDGESVLGVVLDGWVAEESVCSFGDGGVPRRVSHGEGISASKRWSCAPL